MSFAFTMSRARRYASDDLAQEILGRITRLALVMLGLAIVAAGILIAPLPGPGGIPVIVVGLMLILRNSFRARRQFVKFQRRHPKMVYPIRRLLRREPEMILVAWQQTLRIERIVLPARLRVLSKLRRYRRLRARRRAGR